MWKNISFFSSVFHRNFVKNRWKNIQNAWKPAWCTKIDKKSCIERSFLAKNLFFVNFGGPGTPIRPDLDRYNPRPSGCNRSPSGCNPSRSGCNPSPSGCNPSRSGCNPSMAEWYLPALLSQTDANPSVSQLCNIFSIFQRMIKSKENGSVAKKSVRQPLRTRISIFSQGHRAPFAMVSTSIHKDINLYSQNCTQFSRNQVLHWKFASMATHNTLFFGAQGGSAAHAKWHREFSSFGSRNAVHSREGLSRARGP